MTSPSSWCGCVGQRSTRGPPARIGSAQAASAGGFKPSGAAGAGGKGAAGGGNTYAVTIHIAGGASAKAGGDKALGDLIESRIEAWVRKQAA